MNTLSELKMAEKRGATLIVLPVEQVRAMVAFIENESFWNYEAEDLFKMLGVDWGKDKGDG